MRRLDQTSLLNLLYYNKLPEVYREEDLKQKPTPLPLYRFLKVVSEGGYAPVIRDAEGLLDLVDPETCPEPILRYLLECFGMSYFEDIDPVYQRKLVSSIGDLVKRRGTCSGVKYLARVLTGMDAELQFTEVGGQKVLTVTLLADTLEQVGSIDNDISLVERYLESFISFLVTPQIVASVKTQEVKNTTHYGKFITYYSDYTISPTT